MTTTDQFKAKDFITTGPGYGALIYNGKVVDLIGGLQDKGQSPIGGTKTVMAIQDVMPRGFITPLAIQGGNLNFTFYVKKSTGFFGGLFDSKFSKAHNLAQLFNQQLSDGPVQIMYKTVQVPGASNYGIMYEGVVFTSALRAFNITAESSAAQVTFECTAMYTDAQDILN